ncbi:hypothetical protein K0M31_004304 [Melipona bicolor]|uniref:Uncharacterized protein n=1 Tax=Melipona bicolor TaxID=60889 RepID=A0AA40KN57_9HYME|nr:hypothetical protein K0M31_004304 [Melipona bicolor]
MGRNSVEDALARERVSGVDAGMQGFEVGKGDRWEGGNIASAAETNFPTRIEERTWRCEEAPGVESRIIECKVACLAGHGVAGVGKPVVPTSVDGSQSDDEYFAR